MFDAIAKESRVAKAKKDSQEAKSDAMKLQSLE